MAIKNRRSCPLRLPGRVAAGGFLLRIFAHGAKEKPVSRQKIANKG